MIESMRRADSCFLINFIRLLRFSLDSQAKIKVYSFSCHFFIRSYQPFLFGEVFRFFDKYFCNLYYRGFCRIISGPESILVSRLGEQERAADLIDIMLWLQLNLPKFYID